MNTPQELTKEVTRLTEICYKLQTAQRKVIDYRGILEMINNEISICIENNDLEQVAILRKGKKFIGKFIG